MILILTRKDLMELAEEKLIRDLGINDFVLSAMDAGHDADMVLFMYMDNKLPRFRVIKSRSITIPEDRRDLYVYEVNALFARLAQGAYDPETVFYTL